MSAYDAMATVTEGRGTAADLAAELDRYAGRVRQVVAREAPGDPRPGRLVWTLVVWTDPA